MPSSNIIQIDGFEVVQVLGVLESPPMYLLSLLVLWVIDPSSRDGFTPSLLHVRGCIFCFPMIELPLFWSMALS